MRTASQVNIFLKCKWECIIPSLKSFYVFSFVLRIKLKVINVACKYLYDLLPACVFDLISFSAPLLSLDLSVFQHANPARMLYSLFGIGYSNLICILLVIQISYASGTLIQLKLFRMLNL